MIYYLKIRFLNLFYHISHISKFFTENSVFITVTGTVINIFLTVITAYALSRRNFFGKRLYIIFLLIPMLFNGGLIPNYMLIKNLGLINSYWSVILPGAIDVYYLILLKNVMQNVPQEIFEAAELDGASHWKMIWKIAVPLSKPGILTIGMFYAIRRWNEYFNAMIYINDPGKWPLQVVLRQFIVDSDKAALFGAQSVVGYGAGASSLPFRSLQSGIIIVTVVPILIIYPFILKYFTKGITVGSVKG
ncbi:MAG TPA: carbohydrate ABC transporter permease [Tepiditoga sp.]|nr:carbohydrate ABC transporter permease [Tepiditoga sp.]